MDVVCALIGDEEHRIALMEQHDEDNADLSLIEVDDDRADLLPYWLTTRVAERTVVAIILMVGVGRCWAVWAEEIKNGSKQIFLASLFGANEHQNVANKNVTKICCLTQSVSTITS